jgi:muramidase (phage lysozyme)
MRGGLKKWWRSLELPAMLVGALVFSVGLPAYVIYMDQQSSNTIAYAPLLQLIARAESGDNYNAYFDHAGKPTVDFASMSVAEVLAWQNAYVQQGSPSSAVGRYQIINTTLAGLVRQLHIDPAAKFGQPLQDRLAIALVDRRGARSYANHKITREQFAANLAKEWAALPRVVGERPGESYYASDGLNRSQVAVSEVLAVIEQADI